MDYRKESLKLHAQWKGKIEVIATVPVKNKEDLSLAYTPGVAEPCLEIQKDINKSYELTQPVEYGCGGNGRHGGAGAGRHWPGGGHAGDGRQSACCLNRSGMWTRFPSA